MTVTTHIAYITAETDYRLARARSQYGLRAAATSRRHWVPRRPALQLPRPLRRPIAVG